jgi:hypothetical protein
MTNYLDFERPLAEIEGKTARIALGVLVRKWTSRQRRLIKGRRFVGQPLRRPDRGANARSRVTLIAIAKTTSRRCSRSTRRGGSYFC